MIEWRRLIYFFGLSIKADPSRMIKKNPFFCMGYTPSSSSGQIQIARQQLDKELNLEPPKLRLYQLTKYITADIAPHISSSLRDLSVILINLFYLVVPNWWIHTLQVL